MDAYEDFDEDDDIEFGLYEGQCQGCDRWGPVDDLGLCETCTAKFERDMIRMRNWDYSATAFGLPPEKYEELRQEIIRQYGEKLELVIAEDKSSRKNHHHRR